MTDGGWFACPACASRYSWLEQQAGRRVRCRCGTLIRIPPQAGQDAQVIEGITPSHPSRASESSSAAIELDHPVDTGASDHAQRGSPVGTEASMACRHCGQSMRAFAVLCTNCGHRVEGGRVEQASSTPPATGLELDDTGVARAGADTSRTASTTGLLDAMRRRSESVEAEARDAGRHAWFMDVLLPAILLGAGLLMLPLYAWGYGNPYGELPFWADLVLVGMEVLVNFVCLFLGLILVSKLFGEAVGTLMLTVWKVAVMATFLVAADAMFYWALDVITEGFAQLAGYVRLALRIAVFWPLAAVLFDLEVLETVILFIFSRMIPIVVMMFVVAMVIALFE